MTEQVLTGCLNELAIELSTLQEGVPLGLRKYGEILHVKPIEDVYHELDLRELLYASRRGY